MDEEPSDVNFYGYDAHGPTCLGDDNNVVLEPIEFEHIELLESYVLASVDPLADSNDMGVDLFCKALSSASKSTREIYASWHLNHMSVQTQQWDCLISAIKIVPLCLPLKLHLIFIFTVNT